MVSRHWLYFGGFVISAILLVGTGLMGLVDALSVLSGGMSYGEEFILLAMLEEAVEWVMAGLVLAVFAVLFLTATVVSVLRRTSLPRSDRLVSIVEWVEPGIRSCDSSMPQRKLHRQPKTANSRSKNSILQVKSARRSSNMKWSR